MINKEILQEIGLSKNEAEIYLILLKKGESSIYDIANNSKISRPNIYDLIKKLKEKGLVSSIIKKKRSYFKATNPENLLNILKEKESNLLNILPQLTDLYESKGEEMVVEVFQGKEGLKILMNDMLKAKEILIFNGSDVNNVLNQIPDFSLDRFLIEKKRKRIRTKVLYMEGVKPVKGPNYQYKTLPRGTSLGCVNYWTYNDRVVIGIWSNILMFIRITSKDVAKAYKQSISLIWRSIK